MLETNNLSVTICLYLFCTHLLIYTYNFFSLIDDLQYSHRLSLVIQYLFNQSEDLHIICQTRIRLSKPISVRYQSKLLISFQTSHSDLSTTTTTTMLMAGPLRCPGTPQYKVSAKIIGQRHISWCLLAVLLISSDVGISPTMLDSNALLVFNYKVMKITLAHSYFQSGNQFQKGWSLALNTVFLWMSTFSFRLCCCLRAETLCSYDLKWLVN